MGVKTAEIPHGTLSGYKNHKCRCDDCREAKVSRDREYRERKKAEQPVAQIVEYYSFTVCCKTCGGPVEHVADGRPTEGGGRSSVTCRCVRHGCNHSWIVTALMQSVTKDPADEW